MFSHRLPPTTTKTYIHFHWLPLISVSISTDFRLFPSTYLLLPISVSFYTDFHWLARPSIKTLTHFHVGFDSYLLLFISIYIQIYVHRLLLTSISTSISTSTDFCWLPSTSISTSTESNSLLFISASSTSTSFHIYFHRCSLTFTDVHVLLRAFKTASHLCSFASTASTDVLPTSMHFSATFAGIQIKFDRLLFIGFLIVWRLLRFMKVHGGCSLLLPWKLELLPWKPAYFQISWKQIYLHDSWWKSP